MDAAVLAWILVPLLTIHAFAMRRPALLRCQLVLDLALLLLPGRHLVTGRHLGPGVAGATDWGAPRTVAGSPEQVDLTLQLGPWWEEVRRLAAAGEPPWITDRIGGGVPLFANGQTNLPFPLHLPVWVLGATRGSDVIVIWKLELAALGAFVLLRRLGLRAAVATLGAVAFGFGLFPLSWAVSPLAWMAAATPWAFWLMIGALRGDRRNAAALAVLLGVLAGWSVNPEGAAFLWLGVAVSGVVLAWGRRGRVRRLVAPFLLALLVAGIGIAPTVASIAASGKLHAATATSAYPAPGLDWRMRGRAASLVLAPWREGHPADGSWRLPFPAAAVAVSVGVLPWVFLVAAAPRRRHRRVALALVVLAATATVLVYQLPFASNILGRLPVLSVMVWVRSAFLVSFAVAMLGALSADAWLRNGSRRRLALSGLSLAAVAVALLLVSPASLRSRQWRGMAPPLLVAAAAPIAGGLGGWLLPGIGLAEACLAGWDVGGASVAGDESPFFADARRLIRAEPGRVVGVGAALPPNLGAGLGLSDLRANDPTRNTRLVALHHALGSAGDDLPGPLTRPWAGLAGAWGVRWLIAPAPGLTGPAAAGWQEALRGDRAVLYRNARALPVVRLATQAILSPGDPTEGSWQRIDFAVVAVTEEPVSLGGSGRIEVLEDRPAHHTVRAVIDGKALVVLHVPSAPGWRAELNGRPVAIRVADLAAMAVSVPAGEHVVVFRYWPPGLIPGALMTLLGLIAAGVWARSSRSSAPPLPAQVTDSP